MSFTMKHKTIPYSYVSYYIKKNEVFFSYCDFPTDITPKEFFDIMSSSGYHIVAACCGSVPSNYDGNGGWNCSECGKPVDYDQQELALPTTLQPTGIANSWFPKKVCECGGTKAGTTHVHWCPLFNP